MLAEIQDIDGPRSLSFVSTLHPAPKDGDKIERQVLQGLWWRLDENGNGYLALTNNATTNIAVELTLQSGKRENITVPAQQTRFIKAWHPFKNTSGRYGALDIEYTGSADAISVNAGTYDDERGFSAGMAFYRLSRIHPLSKTSTRTFVAPGMMVGAPDPMMMFPSGTNFHPYAFVRNIGTQPIVLNPVVYLEDSTDLKLAPLVVPPNSVAEVPVAQAAMKAQAKDMITLALHASGDPRFLLVQTGSIDESGTYVFEVPSRLVQTTVSQYICHWLAEGDNDTMISVANTESAPQDLILRLNFGNDKHYLVPVHLKKGETRMWNLSGLLMNATPDKDGNLPPPGVTEGSAEILNSIREDKPITVASQSFY